MVLILGFIVQSVVELFSGSTHVKEILSLSHGGLKEGFIWQIVTYGLLHDGPLHLIFNLLGIHFIGRSLYCRVWRAYFIYYSGSSVSLVTHRLATGSIRLSTS